MRNPNRIAGESKRAFFQRWRKWAKGNKNNKRYQISVLLGLVASPTLEFTLSDEEERAFYDGFMEGLYGRK